MNNLFIFDEGIPFLITCTNLLLQCLGRTQIIYTWNLNDLCFDWTRPCFGGLTFKNRGHLGSRYVIICMYLISFVVKLECVLDVVTKMPKQVDESFGFSMILPTCKGLEGSTSLSEALQGLQEKAPPQHRK